ncbi:MAG: DUF951 domain-containing protein [Syntrophomonadaceae bacterium]
MENKTYKLGDLVRMKKKHPCGSSTWKIIRMGADIKIQCQGCGRIVMLTRSDFNKRMLRVESPS